MLKELQKNILSDTDLNIVVGGMPPKPTPKPTPKPPVEVKPTASVNCDSYGCEYKAGVKFTFN